MAKPIAFDDEARRGLEEGMAKLAEAAGGGTATATVLARSMVHQGLRKVAAGANPAALKRGMDKATEAITAQLLASARPVGGKQDLAAVAALVTMLSSPPGDEDDVPEYPDHDAGPEEALSGDGVTAARASAVGLMVAQALDKVGRNGVITVETAATPGLTLDLSPGLRLDRGYISRYFVTDPERMEAVLDAPLVLVMDSIISRAQDLVPTLELVAQLGRPLLVVAWDVEAEALATLMVNKIRGSFSSVAVKAPGFGDHRQGLLTDLAIVTGGQVISDPASLQRDVVVPELLGSARRVIVTKDDTIIVDGGGAAEEIRARLNQITAEIDQADSDDDREKLALRLDRLSAGAAVITVGALDEAERRGRKRSIENAIRATMEALDEGIVAGGGAALLQSTDAALDRLDLEGDEAAGANIVRVAAEVPLRQIATTAGLDGATVAEKVRYLPEGWGLNAASGDYVDLIAAGIVDPAKVTRSALQKAASIAAHILVTESATEATTRSVTERITESTAASVIELTMGETHSVATDSGDSAMGTVDL